MIQDRPIKKRRLMTAFLAPSGLLSILQGRSSFRPGELPADVRVHDVIRHNDGSIGVVLESDEFPDEYPEGSLYPFGCDTFAGFRTDPDSTKVLWILEPGVAKRIERRRAEIAREALGASAPTL